MKCALCDGKGKYKNGLGVVSRCYYCLGTGEVNDKCERVRTNEEWFCQLPTEEKVKALLNLHEKVRQRMRTDIGRENSFYKGDYYRKWLKQPHTEKE